MNFVFGYILLVLLFIELWASPMNSDSDSDSDPFSDMIRQDRKEVEQMERQKKQENDKQYKDAQLKVLLNSDIELCQENKLYEYVTNAEKFKELNDNQFNIVKDSPKTICRGPVSTSAFLTANGNECIWSNLEKDFKSIDFIVGGKFEVSHDTILEHSSNYAKKCFKDSRSIIINVEDKSVSVIEYSGILPVSDIFISTFDDNCLLHYIEFNQKSKPVIKLHLVLDFESLREIRRMTKKSTKKEIETRRIQQLDYKFIQYKGDITKCLGDITIVECEKSNIKYAFDNGLLRYNKDVNKCLSAGLPNNNVDGLNIIFKPCDNGDKWIITSDGKIALQSDTSRALNIQYGDDSIGKKMQIYRTSGSHHLFNFINDVSNIKQERDQRDARRIQQLDYKFIQYKGDITKCVGDTTIVECEKSNVKYAFDNGLLRYNKDNNKCLSVGHGNNSNGKDIIIKPCSNSNKWIMRNDGTIILEHDNLYGFNVAYEDASIGRQMQVYRTSGKHHSFNFINDISNIRQEREQREKHEREQQEKHEREQRNYKFLQFRHNKKFCLGYHNPNINEQILCKSCEDKYRYRFDSDGKIHLMENDNLCISADGGLIKIKECNSATKWMWNNNNISPIGKKQDSIDSRGPRIGENNDIILYNTCSNWFAQELIHTSDIDVHLHKVGAGLDKLGITHGETIYSDDHKWSISIDTYGNLKKYYDGNVKSNNILKGFNIRKQGDAGHRKCPYILQAQADGNMVLYNCENKAIWASNTYNPIGATSKLEISNNGLVTYIAWDANKKLITYWTDA